jgi:regulator of RNase E activity RraA
VALWKNDSELFEIARRELFSSVVGDAMDRLGLQRQYLPPGIHPLSPDMSLIGRAMPVLEADIFEEPEKPFGLMFEALDDLKQDEVYLCVGGSPRYAMWGENMSTRAMKLGAAGAVLSSYARDTHGIVGMGFPTFALGSYGQDQAPRGMVIDFRCKVEIEGVVIRTGDIIVGDVDGVLVVPNEAEEEVFSKSIEKARGEKLVMEALKGGMSAVEAYAKFGIM